MIPQLEQRQHAFGLAAEIGGLGHELRVLGVDRVDRRVGATSRVSNAHATQSAASVKVLIRGGQ